MLPRYITKVDTVFLFDQQTFDRYILFFSLSTLASGRYVLFTLNFKKDVFYRIYLYNTV